MTSGSWEKGKKLTRQRQKSSKYFFRFDNFVKKLYQKNMSRNHHISDKKWGIFTVCNHSDDYLKRGMSNFVRWSLINLGEGSDLPLAKNGWYLLVLGDKMRLKSFDFLLFANLPNWHEEWCMLWWLPSSIQFFEGECNAFTFYNFYFDGWEGKKVPFFLPEEL